MHSSEVNLREWPEEPESKLVPLLESSHQQEYASDE